MGNRSRKMGVSKARTLTAIASKVAIVVVEAIVEGCAARAGSAAWIAVLTKVAKAVALRELATAR